VDLEIMYGMATADHMPVSVTLNVNISIPYNALMCGNFNCENLNHREDVCKMYDLVVAGLKD